MEHLPPWLRNAPLPQRPSEGGEPQTPPASASGAELPSWLVELQGEMGTADSESSSWLADPADPPAGTEQGGRRGAFDDAAWLRDADPGEPQPPPAGQGDQQSTSSRVKLPVGATDWLRSIGQDPDARSEPISEPIAGADDQSGVPDWLRDLTADEVARGVEAAPPDSQPRFDPQAPGWLADDLPAPDASTAADPGLPPLDEDEGAQDIPDWLRGVEPAADAPGARRQPPGAGDLIESAEMPAWLRDLGEEPASPEPPALEDEPAWLRDAATRPPTDRLAADEIEVPAWLRSADDQGDGPDAQDQGGQQEAAGDDEMPSWLREAAPAIDQPTGAVPSPPPPRDVTPGWLAASAAQEGELPAWLRDEGASAPEPATGEPAAPWLDIPVRDPGPPEAGDDEVPAWLRDEGAPPEPATGEPAAPWLDIPVRDPGPPEAGDDEVPAWLRDEGASAPEPVAEESAAPWLDIPVRDPGPPEAGDDEVPAWLREIEPAPSPSADERAPWLRDDQAPPAADEFPPWLATDEASGDRDPEAGRSQSPLYPPDQPSPYGDPGLPSWLRGVADETPPPPPGARSTPAQQPWRPSSAAEQGDSHSFLSGAELPSWLRIPEPERPADQEGETLDWLRRLGGPEQDDDSLAPAMAAAVALPRPQYRRSAEQLAAVELLQQLGRTPYPEPAAPAPPAPLTRWQRIGLDRLLYALLAIALLLALLVPALVEPFQTATPTAPGAAELGAMLDGLGEEDVVLLAYEWGAQRSSELRPLEAALTSRLIANRTKLILVSTDLQGTLLSFDLIEPLRAAGYNNQDGVSFGGRDYVLLGYRPGGELALRRLAQDLRGELRSDFDGQDATQGLVANNPDGTPRFDGIADLSAIVVLADQPQDVQAWMEQVRPAAGDVPMAFLLPQEAQPLAQPYLRLTNVLHLSGQQGALALLAGDPAGDPAAIAGATGRLWFAVTAFLVLLAVGAVAALAGRRSTTGGGAA